MALHPGYEHFWSVARKEGICASERLPLPQNNVRCFMACESVPSSR